MRNYLNEDLTKKSDEKNTSDVQNEKRPLFKILFTRKKSNWTIDQKRVRGKIKNHKKCKRT
jgi:hypothetical protein